MNPKILELLKLELRSQSLKQITTVLNLLDDGNTVPFIARYRKEMTGSLDEVEIRVIQERYRYLENLESRKEEVCRLIEEQGKLTEELKQEILDATVLQKVEDLYRPYKQKRRTKATIAKERGLEAFAMRVMSCPNDFNESEAKDYVNEAMEILSTDDVFDGVHEIIAEFVGDQPEHREWIRKLMEANAILRTTLKDESLDERHVYEMYYEFSTPIKNAASHRVLAVNRAEKEGVVKVDVEIDTEAILSYFSHTIIGNATDSNAALYVIKAYEDAYKRFIKPSLDREIRNDLTEKADTQAISIFGENLRNLLLQAPLKGKTVLGFDPAYRTGCKLAIVDETGKVLYIGVIYPHKPADAHKRAEASGIFKKLIDTYNVDLVAIGNGTASRESEVFVAENLKTTSYKAEFVIVNEAGASVYSASDEARKEFPDLQVEQRSAVSIARRLQDPLAELVKIDPKSVGVGQYQHDVSQKNLSSQLDFVVETAVNQVGVDVNTASPKLLEHIAGLTKTTAQNIVTYREENGSFAGRTAIKKVPRLGPKSFEQAIGFLRVPNGKNIFDNTGIHPESYDVAKTILKKLEMKPEDLLDAASRQRINELSITELSSELGVGVETLEDIISALRAPGRDMRESFAGPLLRSDVLTLEDLKTGMELNGTVRNVVDFGAFVDIGVKQDGLVHISKLSKSFVKHPTDVVAVGDIVTVWVMDVDVNKQRVQLSMVPITEAD